MSSAPSSAAAVDDVPPLRIVLIEPEIPPNTGNVIRLAANTGCELHLVEPLGFSMDHKLLKRAGLDYHEFAPTVRHGSWLQWLAKVQPSLSRVFAFSAHGDEPLHDQRFARGDWLVFGGESAGLPPALRSALADAHAVRLPMRAGQRSLNLSNAVAVAVYEAWRQLGFVGAA
jgi:tRNA (cytidine/uridine-2'-O-)-methyltransferase